MTELLADLDSVRIEGYVPDGRRIDIPLISHIEGGLHVGGCIDGVRLPDHFDRVISLYKWGEYELGPTTHRTTFTMYDSAGVDAETVENAASHVVTALKAGETVLVHCQAGLNRSNLVAATALINMGRSASDAIELLRERRSPIVLCNRTFERWLRKYAESRGV